MNDKQYNLTIVRLNTIWTPQWPMPEEQIAEWRQPLCRRSAADVDAAIDRLRVTEEKRPSLAAICKMADAHRNVGKVGALKVHDSLALPEGPGGRVSKDRVSDMASELVARLGGKVGKR